MEAADTAYSSYGWWLHKSANGRTFTASAFTDEKGTVTPASGLDALVGTATYVGGAAGKYSLFSLTGGTNDAGHFTARATLEADFSVNDGEAATDNAVGITGTIDDFIGADGEARNWTVDLMGSPIEDDGGSVTRRAERSGPSTVRRLAKAGSGPGLSSTSLPPETPFRRSRPARSTRGTPTPAAWSARSARPSSRRSGTGSGSRMTT